MGCIFGLIHTIWTVQIDNATIARSEYAYIVSPDLKPKNLYTQRRIIKLETLDEKTMEVHLIVNSNVFYI